MLVGLGVVVLAACGGGGETESPNVVIVAENLRFDTDNLDIAAGEEIVLQVDNRDQSTFHNFHVTDAPGEPASKLAEGPNVETLTFAIDEPGTYTFVCDTHQSMTGTIEVTAD